MAVKPKSMFNDQPLLKSHFESLLDYIIEGFESVLVMLRQKKQSTDFESP
jgi:hypothetical protein